MRRLTILITLALLLSSFIQAKADDAITAEFVGGQFWKVEWDWTSDASGDVVGVTDDFVPGALFSAVTTPSTVDVPSDNYDVVVYQSYPLVGGGSDAVVATDLAGGNLANRDDTNTEVWECWPDSSTSVTGKARIVVSNAGDTKKGRITLMIYSALIVPAVPSVDGDLKVKDDKVIWLGDNGEFRLGYDEATDNRLELTDATPNTFLHLTDQGAYVDVGLTGNLILPDNYDIRLGTASNWRLRFDGTALKFWDGTNSLFTLTDTGTTATLALPGILAVDTDVLYVDIANNRVGVNQATPLSELHVVGALRTSSNALIGGNLYANYGSTAGTLVFGSTTSEGEYIVRSGNDVGYYAGGSQVLHLDGDNERVGIGIAAPTSKLHLYQTDAAYSDVELLVQKVGANGGAQLRLDRSATSRTACLAYSTSGTVDWYTGIVRDGGGATDDYVICVGATTDIFTVPANFILTTAGLMGLGTSTPSVALDVVGAGVFSLDLAVNGGDLTVGAAAANIGTTTNPNQLQFADATHTTIEGALNLTEKSADPTQPTEGVCVLWMSDGTGKGDDGDVLIASTAGGVTKYAILFDHSAGSAW